jgi:hypothetical protein
MISKSSGRDEASRIDVFGANKPLSNLPRPYSSNQELTGERGQSSGRTL